MNSAGMDQPKEETELSRKDPHITDLVKFVRTDEDFLNFVSTYNSDCSQEARETFLATLESTITSFRSLAELGDGYDKPANAVSDRLIEPAEIHMAQTHDKASLVAPTLNFRQGIEQRLKRKIEQLST